MWSAVLDRLTEASPDTTLWVSESDYRFSGLLMRLVGLLMPGAFRAEGKAGTIQEIFQDGARNYYKTFEYFSPMVLLDVKYLTEQDQFDNTAGLHKGRKKPYSMDSHN
jgi:hypothetical protein